LRKDLYWGKNKATSLKWCQEAAQKILDFSDKRAKSYVVEISTNRTYRLPLGRSGQYSSIEGSRTRFQRTNRHSGGDQEQEPWITVKGFVTIVTMNDSVSRWKTKL
jgi:hypothetical protein